VSAGVVTRTVKPIVTRYYNTNPGVSDLQFLVAGLFWEGMRAEADWTCGPVVEAECVGRDSKVETDAPRG